MRVLSNSEIHHIAGAGAAFESAYPGMIEGKIRSYLA
jgi:hypothetical protein